MPRIVRPSPDYPPSVDILNVVDGLMQFNGRLLLHLSVHLSLTRVRLRARVTNNWTNKVTIDRHQLATENICSKILKRLQKMFKYKTKTTRKLMFSMINDSRKKLERAGLSKIGDENVKIIMRGVKVFESELRVLVIKLTIEF